ncbi:MAG TPA: hypothetical protein VL595_16335 [Pseudonocardia sp.]|nr:hypothetical protein [Pseudonocardia sp.]
MSNSTIRAALDNGPRVGEVLEIEPGEDGTPPTTLVVSDPLGEDTTESTTYHLQQEGAEPGTYVYRAGNSSDEADDPDDDPDDDPGSEAT